VLHAARWKCRTEKSPKIRHLRSIAQLCRAMSSQLRHISTIGKKAVKSSISPACPHNMVNFGPLAAEIISFVWVIPANFNGFRVLASLLQRRRSPEAKPTKLCMLFGRLLGGYIIYTFWALLPCNGILPRAKFTLRPSLALSYIGSVTARQWSSGRQPKFAALSRGRHLYSAGRPSRWALAHILVITLLCTIFHFDLLANSLFVTRCQYSQNETRWKWLCIDYHHHRLHRHHYNDRFSLP